MTDLADNEAVGDASKPVLSDSASSLSRRSSSQASHASSGSRKVKTIRGSKNRPSKPVTSTEDAALTSFPSFSPEPDENTTPKSDNRPVRTISQRVQARKATLAGLTSPGLLDRSRALFDDSPRSSLDIPGSLHLSNDDHIKRLVERVGAVQLVRQYAEDLAKRDAEISALRVRADERERELKRMLKEVDIPSAEIEKRLMRLEKPIISTLKESNKPKRTSIDTMMSEAIGEVQSTSPIITESRSTAGLPQPPSTMTRRLKSNASITQLSNENVLSQDSSRANSIVSSDERDLDSTIRQKQTSAGTSTVMGLQNMFQPPTGSTSYFIGGSNKTLTKTKAADEVSVKSTQSAKSTTSWTRIFGGRSTANRSRASSVEQSKKPKDESLASAKLRNAAGNNTVKASSRSRPQPQRAVTGGSTTHARKESNASNLPPTVELDSMIEESELPPTMTRMSADGLLVDRYGFIYDKKRKRQQVAAQKHTKGKPSISESLASFRSGDGLAPIEQPNRSATPVSIDEDAPKTSWQDYLLPAGGTSARRPRELLSHTPSAGAVVTVNTADVEGTITPPRQRDTSNPVTTLMQKSMPSVVTIGETQPSAVAASSTTAGQDSDTDFGETGATKALLDQLTELHDNLQAERTIKWNDFLRRVRVERSTNPERSSINAPEADLVNGELIGIATLGRSSKTKAKYMHFKSLVLSGIPVALRPKIWAECSGATSLRIPGYYEDLVARSNEDTEIQADIAQQITADVKRTLRDNVFFRDPNATGVRRLEELLRAYSLHNPRIGYCQGMNLITGSLLLICATSEDCFWLLVAIIDYIIPSGYFDESLLVARADQLVLRNYVAEVLPRLDAKLTELGVELEACTFHWFLSLYTGILTGGEALYRVWDVVLCLNSSDSAPIALQSRTAAATLGVEGMLNAQPPTPTTPATPLTDSKVTLHNEDHDGTSSPFLFQLSLALLKLNEEAIIALDSPAQVYTYLNHNMTAHNITIDALINASELLRSRIKRSDVLDRRKKAVDSLR